jgi:hypothetical protein
MQEDDPNSNPIRETLAEDDVDTEYDRAASTTKQMYNQ